MQEKNCNTKQYSADIRLNKTPWHKSQGWLFSLIIVSVIHFVIASTFVSNELSIKQSVLILKHDGCDMVKEYGIATEPHGADECRVTVQFEGRMFGTSGKIHIGDQQIKMGKNQVVVVGSEETHAWTPKIQWLISWLGLSSLIMVAFFLLLLRSVI